MHTPIRIITLLALVSLLAACDISSLGNPAPTPPPVIILASPTPDGGQSTAPTSAAPRPTTAPTAATGAPSESQAPTSEAATAATTTDANGPSRTVTFAFDAFPSYFPGIIAEVNELLQQRGYNLELVPFLLDGQNDFSEQERFDKLRSGEWDVLATTLDGFARQSDPSIGAITAVVDESAGADKLVAKPEIATINDLQGKRIAYSESSVGEYFLYYALSLAGLSPSDVTLVPQPSVADAVNAYTSDQADAVSAWEPDVQAAIDAGGTTLIASDKLRAILDVLITSRNAINNKPEAIQAFHDAWFDALKTMTDNPDEAEQAIIEWGHPDWTFVENPGDLSASLESIAQATLGANQIAFRSPQLLISRMEDAQAVWRRAGQQVPQTDLSQLVDGQFALTSAQNPALASRQPPVNSSFLLTAQVDLPDLSQQEQQQAQEIVKLPLEQIEFQPESTRLTEQAANDLLTQVVPVLKSSRLYLRIEGSSAWPGPEGRFSEEDIRSFAEARATSVATFLSQQGIDPSRLLIGTIPPKFPNSLNEQELAQDRFVRFTLIAPQGR